MPLPEWLKVKHKSIHKTKSLLRSHSLYTVCEEARCPNQSVCFSRPVATFMILGDCCTRSCAFCAVSHGIPKMPDPEEPKRIAEAVIQMGLKYVVITSVTRDDLHDGGASQFAECIRHIRAVAPGVKIEILTPDFQGNAWSLKKSLEALPDVFNHNMETVSRLYYTVRPKADYNRSLLILKNAKDTAPQVKTKSGFMLGLGEERDEILQLMMDLRAVGCDMLTIGQYMRPSRRNLPVVAYIRPEVFEELRETALQMGFSVVASAPLVRSSMNAEEMYLPLQCPPRAPQVLQV